MMWGVMIIGALLAFEMFNYSTTEFALADLLGDLNFVGVHWSTILAIAFCGIDFAGIARLFTPEQGADEPAEVWYLFGAWLLAATMNAMLTWWGVSIAILEHESLGNAVVERATLLKAVPIFVALMVWLSRVLIIGTFSVAGERLFSQADLPTRIYRAGTSTRTSTSSRIPFSRSRVSSLPRPAFRPAPKPKQVPRSENIFDRAEGPPYSPRPEPTYHPVGLRSRKDSQSSKGF